ncbi:DUF3592 domain-containing protein [Undibacterium sp. Rencai35W]|uniref:DUF3592 domain-containing protein n=1 Tax=Undibacterium sp. Rencai35W TaxID=3413046 RepID=UPI003BF1FB9E
MKNPIFWLSLFCAMAFLWQLFKLSRGLKSQSWPATVAVIKSVSIEGRDQGDGDIAYNANVEYDYHVNGKNYTSNRFTYAESTQLSHEEALALTSGLASGTETNAFYNPSQPAVAVLHKGINRSNLIKTVIVGALTVACLMASIRFV